MNPIVAISTVADGSMSARHDPSNLAIIENRRIFLAAQGITLEQSTRLKLSFDGNDYCRYSEVLFNNKADGMYAQSDTPYDAIVTTEPNHALYLLIADCVGATFYDPVHHVLGLAHLGRHSLEQNGGIKFVAYLTALYKSDPKDLKVWLSPAPGKDVYPIWALDNKGMKEVTFEQLHAAGILDENIIDNPAETNKDKNYFSYSQYLKGDLENDGNHAMVSMMTC